MTKVVGIAEPKCHQLNAYQGSATAEATAGATHQRLRSAGVSR
jgi:hypothetical protein